MTLKLQSHGWSVLFGAAMACGIAATTTWSADVQAESSAQKQRDSIKTLQSDAPPQDKAIACKRLAVYGTKDAVPVLAPLLADERLASWARIALEAIPDPAADAALREALGKVQGRLLVGVINSIGVRRDQKAVGLLVKKLKDTNADVAAAAAAALGRIGNDRAVKALKPLLSSSTGSLRSEAAEACILCAERLLAEKKSSSASKLYDAVRKASVPKQRVLEATRGAILARGSGGLTLLLEQLRSPDKALFGIGLRVARELPGREVSKALAAEFQRASAERQVPMLALLADRGDAEVLPAISQAARQGAKPVRLAAINALERLDNAGCVPALLDVAADQDSGVAQAAISALVKLSAKEVDTEVRARLSNASGRMLEALIEVANLRRIEAALPAIVGHAQSQDAGVRSAAVAAVGALGAERQAGDLAGLLQKTQNNKERGDIERALLAICGRRGAACVPHLLPLAQSSDSELRKIALHTFSSVGGDAALSAVKAALEDKDEAVQDEAVRTLSTWPGNWPDDAGVAEPLLALVKSGKKLSHQVLGLRGYLHYIQGHTKLGDADKLARLEELLPLISRPEEKKLAVPVITAVATGKALELLVSCAADSGVAEEACLAIVSLAVEDNLKDATKELRQKALQTVLEKSQDEATKNKAQEALKKLE